ncbi:MAG: hypothetical protein K6E60_09080 [Saccharofermentans sp.]|nr:hypothetical protein [Saccharofermentans sp.]
MANTWKCSCGQDNDGNFCINCGSTKPEGAENTVGAPAPVPAAVAPVETPAAAAPAEPETPAAVAPAAAPVEPVKAEEPEAPAAEPAPAVAPVVAPVAAAAAVDAATTDEEPVQVIKCQPMPETPMEDYSSVPADPEFAEAENVPLHDTYQPAPVAVAPVVAPVASAAPVNEPPKQVGPVNYQNTSSNPYAEPDRASHNPYAPAPVNAQPYNGGYAAAPASNSGTGLLILGIVAVVLAFDVTLGAIICGAIGCSQAKKLKLPDGSYPTGKAKVGAILSKIGLIIGIVMTIIAIIWCIVVVVGIIAGAGYALSH